MGELFHEGPGGVAGEGWKGGPGGVRSHDRRGAHQPRPHGLTYPVRVSMSFTFSNCLSLIFPLVSSLNFPFVFSFSICLSYFFHLSFLQIRRYIGSFLTCYIRQVGFWDPSAVSTLQWNSGPLGEVLGHSARAPQLGTLGILCGAGIQAFS